MLRHSLIVLFIWFESVFKVSFYIPLRNKIKNSYILSFSSEYKLPSLTCVEFHLADADY